MRKSLPTKTEINRSALEKDRHMEQLDRITQQPGIMGGKACIRGMRVTAGYDRRTNWRWPQRR
jgi:hypothetical protein